MSRLTVLVYVQISSHFREMFRVAELLRDSDRYEPVVLFMAPYAGSADHIETCRQSRVRSIGPDQFHLYVPPEVRRSSWLSQARRAAKQAASASTAALRRAGGRLRRAGQRLGRAAAGRTPAWLRRPVCRVVAPAWRSALAATRATARRAAQVSSRTRAALVRLGRSASTAGTLGCLTADRVLRRVLMARVPTAEETARTLKIPGMAGAAILVLAAGVSALTRPVLWLARPVLARLALLGFGAVYARLPRLLPADIQAHRYAHRLAPALASALDVRLLVIPEDNFYYFTNVFIQAVHEHGGRAVVVPFTIVNTLEWSEAFYRLAACDARRTVNLAVGYLFPRWKHEHKGVSLVMPPQQVLANEYLGVAPPIPWLINSGRSDAIAVESLFMEQYYVAAGIPGGVLRLTGSLADDTLYRLLSDAGNVRRQMYEELGLTPDLPMLLCALPPNQLGGDGRPGCEFQDYGAVVSGFLAPLEALSGDYNVVLSLHPRMSGEDRAALAGRRIFCAPRDVAELIPLCHVYVASCSATIRLAISCGIPVVNYDVYVYDYDDYTRVPGVVTVSKHDEYRAALDAVVGSPETHARLKALQADFARREAFVDGRAGERLLALLDELTSSSRA